MGEEHISRVEKQDSSVYDVAVIGAGPIGSFTAERIARAGLSVALFERDSEPGASNVCAGGMHIDLAEMLDLPQSLIEKVLPRLRITINGRTSELRSGQRAHCTVQRDALDRFLVGRAVAAGTHLFTRARVLEVHPEAGSLCYEIVGTHERVTVEARVMIFADGPRTLARRTFGVKHPHRSAVELVGVEYDLEAPENPWDAIELIAGSPELPFGYLWVFPKRNRINVGACRLSSHEGVSLWHVLDEFISSRQDLNRLPQSLRRGGIIPAAVNPVLQKHNCLVVGDAAGMVNPLTGGGYVCGFLSGIIASATVLEAFQGSTPDLTTLSRYSKRLLRTPQVLAIRFAGHSLRAMIPIVKATGYPLYLPIFHAYLQAFRLASRFVRAI